MNFVKKTAPNQNQSDQRIMFDTTAVSKIKITEVLAVIVMNRTKDEIPYYLWINGEAAETKSLPHSISTFIIR